MRSPVRFDETQRLMAEHRVPVVVEIILERITNIAMGTELDNVTELEELATEELDERGPHTRFVPGHMRRRRIGDGCGPGVPAGLHETDGIYELSMSLVAQEP
jgi:hypothetical protein